MMVTDSHKLIVLDMATEDSYGLWEVDWAFRTEFPEVGNTAARSLAISTVRELVDEDLIQLFRAASFKAPEVLIPKGESESILTTPINWEPKFPNEEQITVFATDLGEQRYSELYDALKGSR